MEKKVKGKPKSPPPKQKPAPIPKSAGGIVSLIEELRADLNKTRKERDADRSRASNAERELWKAENKMRELEMTAKLAESRAAALGQRDAEIKSLRGRLSTAATNSAKAARAVDCVRNLQMLVASALVEMGEKPHG